MTDTTTRTLRPVALTTADIPHAERIADLTAIADQKPHTPGDLTWLADARCATLEPDVFFPKGDSDTAGIAKATAYCQACPVQQACRFSRYDTGTTGVVMGGVYYGEHARGQRPCAFPGCTEPAVNTQNGYCGPTCEHKAKVGTMGGYRFHTNSKTEVCTPCREARHAESLKYRAAGATAHGTGRAVIAKPNAGRRKVAA